ncbi:diheme cytochrome C [Lyngbya aestuarii]|uniref:diheme cytochrome C n=1 Tax=Lyngbya aestuarii TaxID=118322 RepID=UPI00403E1FE5
MSKRARPTIQRRKPKQLTKGHRQRRSPVVLLLVLVFWSILLGWGIELALGATSRPQIVAQATPTGTVDPVPARYQLGKELYLENCGTCHAALPPEVMPSDTWRQLLLNLNEHYGSRVEPIIAPSVLLIWNYVRDFSRPLGEEESTPYHLTQSRYFQALHPQVEFAETVRPASCVSCHPGAAQYDYRTLAPEWSNSP